MKIQAAITDKKFLVEMDEDEIAKAAGFSSTWNKEFEALNGGRQIKVGSIFKVEASYSYHARVLQHQKEAGSAANTLRALADLIGGTLPDVVIPPPEDGISDNEVFIVWTGDREKPDLADDTLVEVQTRDGRTDKARVKRIWWKHSNPDDPNFNSDIIRYRVAKKGDDL